MLSIKYVLTTWCCFWATVLPAQWTAGLYAGANSNVVRLSGDSPVALSPRANGIAGGQCSFYLWKRWSLQMGAQYIARGYGDSFYKSAPPTTSGIVLTTDFRFNYIDSWSRIAYDVTPHFKVSAGGYVGYMLNSKIREVGSETWGAVPFQDFFSRWDGGPQIGFSMHYRRLYYFANFSWAFAQLAAFTYNNPESGEREVARMRNATFQMGAGFDLFKKEVK